VYPRAAGAAACDGRSDRMSTAGSRKGLTPSNTPHGLLWSTGIIAFILGIVAFVLWGINGAGTLFDMLAALCT